MSGQNTSNVGMDGASAIISRAALVSVVVPCYNYGRFLSEALKSLVGQSHANWECIIIDDGSVDNTRVIADRYLQLDGRFKYLFQSNQGLSAARNAGIGVCNGEYVQFLDADDRIEEKKLERQVMYLSVHPDVDIVYSNVRYFSESDTDAHGIGGVAWDWMSKRAENGKDILDSLVRGNITVVNAPLLRRSAIRDVGGFDQSLLGHEDWEFWIRCALADKRFQFVDEERTCALVRIHGTSMSQDSAAMLMSHIKVRERLRGMPISAALHSANRYQAGLVLARLAKIEFRSKQIVAGLKHGVLAVWRSRGEISIVFQLLSVLLPEHVAVRLKSMRKNLHVLF